MYNWYLYVTISLGQHSKEFISGIHIAYIIIASFLRRIEFVKWKTASPAEYHSGFRM